MVMEEIAVVVFAVAVMIFVAWNVKRGAFVIDPGKFVIAAIVAFAIVSAGLVLSGSDIAPTARALLKIGAAGVLFAGTIPMVAAAIGLFRFGDEYGPAIFYARNHITGVIDTVAALAMIFAGLQIFRLDLAAVGFFFFMLIPFAGNALANSYYETSRRTEK